MDSYNLSAPIVFVVPPNAAIKCPIHNGVFVDPVCAPCGCTFCKRCIESVIGTAGVCPTHKVSFTQAQLRPNINAKGVVDDLLIYCKGGLQKNANGEWVPCASGCNMWITLGKRREHESSCPHALAIKDVPSEVPAPIPAASPLPAVSAPIGSAPAASVPIGPPFRCLHYEQGCLFSAQTDQDLAQHVATGCGYVGMLQHIGILQQQVQVRDQEIQRLNTLIAQLHRNNEFDIRESASKILSSVQEKLEKLDENSKFVMEEAKSQVSKTKTNVQNSTAYQQSLTAFANIKQVVEQALEQARQEILAKRGELSEKITRIISRPNSPASPTTTTTTTAVSSDDVASPAPPADDVAADIAIGAVSEESSESGNPPVVEAEPVPQAPEPEAVVGDDVDEEIKAFLVVSKETYKQEQEARETEEAQFQQALRLSMLDSAKSSQ